MEGNCSFGSSNEQVGCFLNDFETNVIDVFTSDEKLRYRIDYCLLEVINNAVEHGNQGDKDKFVTVEWKINDRTLEIKVTDEGPGFIPEIPLKPPSLSQPRGRGFYSVKQYTKNLQIEGNKIRMVFEREDEKAMSGKPKIDVLFLGTDKEFGGDAAREMEAIIEVMDKMEHAVSAASIPVIIVLELAVFRLLPSKFIGALGRAASSDLIVKVCLCNVHANILDTLKMLGIVGEEDRSPAGTMGKIKIYRDRAETLLRLGDWYDLQLY